MTHPTPKSTLEKRAAKAARRAQRVADNAALAGEKVLQPKRKRRKPSARKTAFLRLKANRDVFVKLRAKHRNRGFCEVGMNCGGLGHIELVYHVFPAAMGNAIKHDARNLLGACSKCNGAEYFARKRGDSEKFHARHRAILGTEVWNELRAAQGRQQISTVEANGMADEYERRIVAGEWRL